MPMPPMPPMPMPPMPPMPMPPMPMPPVPMPGMPIPGIPIPGMPMFMFIYGFHGTNIGMIIGIGMPCIPDMPGAPGKVPGQDEPASSVWTPIERPGSREFDPRREPA